jgi:hypothetical protein
MAQFTLYNYEFGKIKNLESADLFGNTAVLMDAEEAFPQRQQILDDILKRDYERSEEITFVNNYNNKEYGHMHMMAPTDGMAVIRVRNVVRKRLYNADWTTEIREDYPDCIIIIDNRPGIQRIAIETKQIAFKGIWTLPNIVSATLNKILRPYSLYVELRNLPDERDFWGLVGDRQKYPNGFYKIRFHLPHLNLERLRKVFDRVGEDTRRAFASDLTLELTAEKGGALSLDPNDTYQTELIHAVSEVGGRTAGTRQETVISVYSNDNKRKPIHIGTNSFKTFYESNSTFDRLAEDAADNTLFDSDALDSIKKQTKWGIN